jgi:DNA-binding NtrC family response regulator
MSRVRLAVERMAASDYPVLITGESGVGKELVARAVHDGSRRRSGPYVAVNCGCIPPQLAESELFGAARGAFTGAQADRAGLFEGAHEGTLFLDEIEALSMPVQERLLRVIESKSFRRLGDLRLRHADVRVVSAGNRSLLDMVREGLFRHDLYYRLNVLAIEVPPLRERPEDIPDLAEEFLRRAQSETGKEGLTLGAAAIGTLVDYSWPGNVRELENAVRRAVVCADRTELGREDFAFLPRSGATVQPRSLKEFARQQVAGRRHSLSEVARRLGISRKTLWQWRREWEGEPVLQA